MKPSEMNYEDLNKYISTRLPEARFLQCFRPATSGASKPVFVAPSEDSIGDVVSKVIASHRCANVVVPTDRGLAVVEMNIIYLD